LSSLLQTGLFAHPIYSPEGDYPEVVKVQVDKISTAEGYNRSRLRIFTPEEISTVKGKSEQEGIGV
jgi:lactase-phlorizin hydrolase